MKKSYYTCEFLVSAGVVQAGKVWILFIYMGVCNAGTLKRQDIISISPPPPKTHFISMFSAASWEMSSSAL